MSLGEIEAAGSPIVERFCLSRDEAAHITVAAWRLLMLYHRIGALGLQMMIK